MLLRDPPNNDPDVFNAMGTHNPSPSPSPSPDQSVPPRPTQDHQSDHFDDVWGDDDQQNIHEASSHVPPAAPSDIPRLQQEHETAGYRDGITAAKATSVQAGFDEGYGLGATIGLRAGELLGVLEGLVNAVSADRRDPLRRLWDQARGELSVQAVFGKEYWSEDGTWSYAVQGEERDGEAVFTDVAAAHPLLKKWDTVVRAEAARFGVDWDVLKEEVEEDHGHAHGHGHIHGAERRDEVKGVPAKGKAALEW